MDLNQYYKVDYLKDNNNKNHDDKGLPQFQLTEHKNFCLE